MPDFLLCNSKLTFQMTMIPDKTNYLTQGPDGVKRLKQGPDLGSYRGLSVIHSRAFSMEAGQQPRDILRRRVRTAEYYRIPPNKANLEYDFELYNEERDTWFSMSFKDLLKMATLGSHGETFDGVEGDHVEVVQKAYEEAIRRSTIPGPESAAAGGILLGKLGATVSGGPGLNMSADETAEFNRLLEDRANLLENNANYFHQFFRSCDLTMLGKHMQLVPAFGMGLKPSFSPKSRIEKAFYDRVMGEPSFMPFCEKREHCFVMDEPRVAGSNLPGLFQTLRSQRLYKPFVFGEAIAEPGTADWFKAFTYYISVYQRRGVFMGYWDTPAENLDDALDSDSLASVTGSSTDAIYIYDNIVNNRYTGGQKVHIGFQWLSPVAGFGAVNDPFHLIPAGQDLGKLRMSTNNALPDHCRSFGGFVGRSILMTWELLEPLMTMYRTEDAGTMTGIQLLLQTRLSNVMMHSFRYALDTIREFLVPKFQYPFDHELFTVMFTEMLRDAFSNAIALVAIHQGAVKLKSPLQVTLAEHGIDTWPMTMSTLSRYEHSQCTTMGTKRYSLFAKKLGTSFGHLNLKYLETNIEGDQMASRWKSGAAMGIVLDSAVSKVDGTENFQFIWNEQWTMEIMVKELVEVFGKRLFARPVFGHGLKDRALFDYVCQNTETSFVLDEQRRVLNDNRMSMGPRDAIGPDVSKLFIRIKPTGNEEEEHGTGPVGRGVNLEDVELVIVRPNIEHSMLGIIMGLGGNELGNTLWGQTELSVYDDSMHGIWGM